MLFMHVMSVAIVAKDFCLCQSAVPHSDWYSYSHSDAGDQFVQHFVVSNAFLYGINTVVGAPRMECS